MRQVAGVRIPLRALDFPPAVVLGPLGLLLNGGLSDLSGSGEFLAAVVLGQGDGHVDFAELIHENDGAVAAAEIAVATLHLLLVDLQRLDHGSGIPRPHGEDAMRQLGGDVGGVVVRRLGEERGLPAEEVVGEQGKSVVAAPEKAEAKAEQAEVPVAHELDGEGLDFERELERATAELNGSKA